MPKKNASTIVTAILLSSALYLISSLLIATSTNPLPPLTFYVAFPGIILLSTFSWTAFFIPLYLSCSAAILVSKVFRKDLFFLLNTSIIPFVTVSAFLRVVFGATDLQGLNFALDVLGTKGTAFVLMVLSAIEVLAIARLKYAFFPVLSPPAEISDPDNERSEESDREQRYEDLSGPAERMTRKLKLKTPIIAVEDGEESQIPQEFESHSSGIANLRIPEVPKLPVLGSTPHEDRDIDPPAEHPIRDIDDAVIVGIDESRPEEYVLKQEKVSPTAPLMKKTRKRGKYTIPAEGLLDDYPGGAYWEIDEDTKRAASVLQNTLEEFRIQAEVTGIRKGPVITMFEILPAPGVRLSKITNLADNIALRLAASRVRIVAPIPGKHAVGIEVPNKKRAVVSFKEMVQEKEYKQSKHEIPICLGKDITGVPQIIDLVQTPHLLIAGATGAGKSVCVNSIIGSILYRRSPKEVRLLLIDPKIVELKFYNDVPHLLTPVITEPKRAFQALQYCIYEMERRYAMLDTLGVRDIRSYNKKIEAESIAQEPLPYYVIIVDEFADLMATTGKELESTLARLAAMSRAVGIHLVLATQRPSIDVITGLIKANIPSRIAFMVASKFDSRIIIDTVGAEKLLGKGDMLFTSAWDPVPSRLQGPLLSDDEVERVTDYIKTLGEPEYIDDEIFFEDEEADSGLFSEAGDDPLTTKALEIVLSAGKASASYLQRRLKIGYNRAARLVEEMERKGIVGPQNGSKPREVLHVPDDMHG